MMNYLDPMPVKCNKCGYLDKYPVKQLISFEACCNKCNSNLDYIGLEINNGMKNHFIDTWPFFIFLDMIEKFNINIGDVSDEEFDNIQTLSDLIKIIEEKQCSTEIVKDIILGSERLKYIRNNLTETDICNAKLSNIAKIIYEQNHA